MDWRGEKEEDRGGESEEEKSVFRGVSFSFFGGREGRHGELTFLTRGAGVLFLFLL